MILSRLVHHLLIKLTILDMKGCQRSTLNQEACAKIPSAPHLLGIIS